MGAILDVVVDTQPRAGPSIRMGCSASIADGAGRRTSVGSAKEAAAALDTMRVMKLLNETTYARGNDLVEGIVAMLTKMT
jgi:hypothetical protein